MNYFNFSLPLIFSLSYFSDEAIISTDVQQMTEGRKVLFFYKCIDAKVGQIIDLLLSPVYLSSLCTERFLYEQILISVLCWMWISVLNRDHASVTVNHDPAGAERDCHTHRAVHNWLSRHPGGKVLVGRVVSVSSRKNCSSDWLQSAYVSCAWVYAFDLTAQPLDCEVKKADGWQNTVWMSAHACEHTADLTGGALQRWEEQQDNKLCEKILLWISIFRLYCFKQPANEFPFKVVYVSHFFVEYKWTFSRMKE